MHALLEQRIEGIILMVIIILREVKNEAKEGKIMEQDEWLCDETFETFSKLHYSTMWFQAWKKVKDEDEEEDTADILTGFQGSLEEK